MSMSTTRGRPCGRSPATARSPSASWHPARSGASPGSRGRTGSRSRSSSCWSSSTPSSVVAIPLLFRVIIDEVDTGGRSADKASSSGSPWPSPGSRSSTPGSRSCQRYFSSRIGEGLIYDLRTLVFAHVQRMPVAFFTRTQTGALSAGSTPTSSAPSRRSPRPCPRVVSNVISARARPRRDALRCRWQITLGALVLLPAVPAARPVGRAAGSRPSPARRCSSTPR